MKKKVTKSRPSRTMHLDTRVTREESETIRRKAEECGLTVSDYMRRCALGHSPRKHLTDREIDAMAVSRSVRPPCLTGKVLPTLIQQEPYW